jgi:hypothetical protein
MAEAKNNDSTVTADPQDPLPESNWLHRRILAYGAFIAVSAFLGFGLAIIATVASANPEAALHALIVLSIAVLVAERVGLVLYMTAPSAEQFGKMLQIVEALKAGVTFRTTETASATGAAASTTTTAQGAPQPLEPSP